MSKDEEIIDLTEEVSNVTEMSMPDWCLNIDRRFQPPKGDQACRQQLPQQDHLVRDDRTDEFGLESMAEDALPDNEGQGLERERSENRRSDSFQGWSKAGILLKSVAKTPLVWVLLVFSSVIGGKVAQLSCRSILVPTAWKLMTVYAAVGLTANMFAMFLGFLLSKGVDSFTDSRWARIGLKWFAGIFCFIVYCIINELTNPRYR